MLECYLSCFELYPKMTEMLLVCLFYQAPHLFWSRIHEPILLKYQAYH